MSRLPSTLLAVAVAAVLAACGSEPTPGGDTAPAPEGDLEAPAPNPGGGNVDQPDAGGD